MILLITKDGLKCLVEPPPGSVRYPFIERAYRRPLSRNWLTKPIGDIPDFTKVTFGRRVYKFTGVWTRDGEKVYKENPR